jgi:integrase
VTAWFGNKPWSDLTREDIKRVYDDLEDGKLRNELGRPYGSTQHYYSKVMKSKPFELAGKADLAKQVIQFPKRERPTVRYVTADEFRRLVSVVKRTEHLLLLWPSWDIGENINTLLHRKEGLHPFGRSIHEGA